MIAKAKTVVIGLTVLYYVSQEVIELVQFLQAAEEKDDEYYDEKKELTLEIIAEIYNGADKFTGIPIEKATVLETAGKVFDIAVQFSDVLQKFRG